MLVHSGSRPHECDICGKRFSLLYNMQTHKKTHLGEKEHKCPCGKGFRQSSNLKQHILSHVKKGEFSAVDALEHIKKLYKYGPRKEIALEIPEPTTLDEAFAGLEKQEAAERKMKASTSQKSSQESTASEPLPEFDSKKADFSVAKPTKEGKKYACPCGREYSQAKNFKQHFSKHVDRGDVALADADRYLQAVGVGKLQKFAPRERKYHCSCGTRYAHARALKDHLEKHVELGEMTPEQAYELVPAKLKAGGEESTPKKAVTVRLPAAPKQTDSGPRKFDKRFFCPCGKAYTQTKNFKEHMLKHVEMNEIKPEEASAVAAKYYKRQPKWFDEVATTSNSGLPGSGSSSQRLEQEGDESMGDFDDDSGLEYANLRIQE